MPEDNKSTSENIKSAFKEPSEKLVKVIDELNKTTAQKLGDLAEKQESSLKGFVKEQSPLLSQTFKFFKGDKKRERAKAMLSAKAMGPIMVKGLSLGLLKFGIGGALGAAKIIDVTESFQDYSKSQDAERREQALELIDELRTGDSPKSMEQIEDILKEQGHKSLDIHDIMKDYNNTLDTRMKDIVTQGIESGKASKDIIEELVNSGSVDKRDIQKQETIKNKLAKTKKAQIPVSKTEEKASNTLEKLTSITGVTGDDHKEKLIEIAQAIDKNTFEIVSVQEYLDLMVDTQKSGNAISVERATTEKKKLEFEKQVEQNDQLRHIEKMDLERDKAEDGGSVFGKLILGLIGLRSAFKGGLGMLTKVGGSLGGLVTTLGPLLAVAGTAFLAFKAGGLINDGINKMVSFVTGKEGDSLGGILHDALSEDTGKKKVSEDKFFATKGGQKVLEIAKRKGLDVTAETSRADVEKFLFERNRQKAVKEEIAGSKVEVKKKASNRQAIEKAETKMLDAEKKAKAKELSVFEKFSDEDAIKQITKQILAELNINIGGAGGVTPSRLDRIPSNSDDLQLAYMSKGDSS